VNTPVAPAMVPPPDTDHVPPDPPPVCVKVTVPPPIHAFEVETTGKAFTVKLPALVAVPSGVVTVIFPVAAVAGSIAVIDVALFTVKDADTPLNPDYAVEITSADLNSLIFTKRLSI
jgi:hypothetical protein